MDAGARFPDDIDLWRQIADEDRCALEELFDRYGQLLFNLSKRIVGDTQHAEDVTLSVFWDVWERPHLYQPERSTPRTYLVMLTRSRAIDCQRRLKVRIHHNSKLKERQLDDGVGLPADAPPAEAVRVENRQLVRAALEQLDAATRQAVELSFFEGLSHREISQTLDIPLGTVKSRVRVALQKLRSTLQRHFSGRDRHEV